MIKIWSERLYIQISLKTNSRYRASVKISELCVTKRTTAKISFNMQVGVDYKLALIQPLIWHRFNTLMFVGILIIVTLYTSCTFLVFINIILTWYFTNHIFTTLIYYAICARVEININIVTTLRSINIIITKKKKKVF